MTKRKTLFGVVAAAILLIPAAVVTTTASSAYAAPSSGCGDTPTLANGTHSITSGGQSRDYILSLPANYDNSHAYRLVVALHWYGGSASAVANGGFSQPYYGLKALSQDAAIFVAPNGLNAGWANTNGRDVTFIDDVLAQIEADLCVDTERVFATGLSYGGAMTYALACARPETYRAVAVMSGGSLSGGCSGTPGTVAYLGIHGVSDTVLSISGARALRDTFVNANGCTPQHAPEPAVGSDTHIVTAYSGCREGYPVVWAAFDGGHIFPMPIDAGHTTSWVPAQIWSFMAQF